MTATPTGRAQRLGFQPVSRWVEAAAYAVPLCVLPSALWRLWALVRGLPAGCRQLVRTWGEVVPGWVPFLGGRAVPVRAVVVAAAIGAAVIFGVYAYALLNPLVHFREPAEVPGCPPPTGQPGAWVAVAAYAPLLAWGPLLVVVTVAYQRRRTPVDRR